ncbi:trichohyalin [Osmerus mordax]|uniref:trichohyalin n=1 Tax=Osmerus mordax TaxID=8014 RepID=UPI0035102AAA
MEVDFSQDIRTKLDAALEETATQNAVHLREREAELRMEAELELVIDKEKNQLLMQQYRKQNQQLQRKLEQLEEESQRLGNAASRLGEELHQERRARGEELRQALQYSQQQAALERSQSRAQLLLLRERNSELLEEVAFLQETVRRECEERGELTATLTQAKAQLLGLRAPIAPLGLSNPSLSQDTPPHLHMDPSLPRLPLARSPQAPPNTLRPSPPLTTRSQSR